MGRNSKLRKARKPQLITLSGEQAEVFDEQMDSDRDWFAGSEQSVRFRPEIPGEFNELKMLGQKPQFIQPYDKDSGGDIDLPMDWVCVINLHRSTKGQAPEGMRTRLRCPAPITGQLRDLMASFAKDYASCVIKALKQRGQASA